ncbi:MAG: hypothetical protein ACAH83_18120 [Alphaproteobacteria bacterium]
MASTKSFNDAALRKVAAAQYSSNVYETIGQFGKGLEGMETELVARWSGDRGTNAEKLARLQRATTNMYSLVGKEFGMSAYDSLRNTSDLAVPVPKVDNHIIDELDMFRMIDKTGKDTWALNSLGKMVVSYMYDEYVAKLQPKPAAAPGVK